MSGMFIEVSVILAWTEFAILFLNEEERRGLRGVRGTKFSSGEVFFKEVFSGFLFIWGEQVNFADLQHKGLVKVDLMVIGSARRDMVSGFFREDLCKVSIF